MAIEARLRELDNRHQALERTLEDELRHPASDPLHVAELKRQKLKLKDQIEELRGSTH